MIGEKLALEMESKAIALFEKVRSLSPCSTNGSSSRPVHMQRNEASLLRTLNLSLALTTREHCISLTKHSLPTLPGFGRQTRTNQDGLKIALISSLCVIILPPFISTKRILFICPKRSFKKRLKSIRRRISC